MRFYLAHIEMKTIEIPRRKFMVVTCPKSAAEAIPVKIVATVDEYFFKLVSETESIKDTLKQSCYKP